MAYKFQLGAARLSGSSTFEDPATFESSLGASSLSASAGVSGLTLDIEKAADVGQKLTVVGVSDLDGGINVSDTFTVSAAGAVAGATTIDASGDLTVGSITMSEFAVDSSGNTDVDGTLNVEGVPTFQAGAVFSAGITTAGAVAGATTISGSGLISGGGLTVGGAVTGGKLVVGSADMSEADLEQLDGITAGSAAASKALVLDSSKNIIGINNLAAAQLSSSAGLSGHSLDIETAADVGAKLTVVGVSDLDGGINVSDTFTVSDAGAVAGATSIDASGDLTVGSITMAEFTVDSSGNTDVDGTLNVEGVPTFQAGAVFSGGITTANAVAGATTISGSGLISGGALTVGGAVTGGKLVVGSADMSETDLEKLDGITNGAVAANKAVVVDGSKDIAGCNNVSGSGDARFFALDVNGSEVISSALQLKAIASLDATTEATIEAAIDTLNNLVSAGASGADLAVKGPLDLEEGLKQNGSVILSDAGALGGLTTISGSGFISGLGLDIETQADIAQKLTVHGVSDLDGGINVDDTFTVSAAGAVAGATTISGSGQISGAKLIIDTNGVIGTAGDANLLTLKNNELSVAGAMKAAGAVSGSGTLQIGGAVTLDGTLELNGVADAAADLAADSLYFLDGDGLVKSERLSDYASSLAGSGLSAASGVLSVTSNNVSSVVSGSTLSEGYNYVAATATASAGMVLPSAPSAGDLVVLKAGAGVSNSNFIEVNTGDNNHKIDGGAGPIRIESPFGAVSLIYVVANDWRIV